MLNQTFIMECKEGFHLRPAQVLMEAVTPFQSSVKLARVEDHSAEADAKSILGLMSLGINEGEKVEVTVSGPDEEKAMETVQKLFASRFEE